MNKRASRIAIFFFLVLFLAASFLFAQPSPVRADSADEIEDNIEKLEKKLKEAQAAKLQLERQLTNINYSVTQTQKDIQLTEQIIDQVEAEISRSEKELESQDQKMKLQRQILSGLLQEMYYYQRESAPLLMLAEKDFSSIFSKNDNLVTLQEKIDELIEQIKGMQAATLKAKNELEVSQEQKEKLLSLKQRQKQELLGDKAETEDSIESKEAVIARLNKELAELQSDLSVLTGKSYNAKDIRQAVEFASKKTGVPEGVLYGFLKMETNLGANTGQCTYSQVVKTSLANYKKYGSKYKASIALLYKREGIFYEIVKELDYSKDKKVSCSPKAYIGQGGAMGVSQFMSDVWRGYESSIRVNTGHSKPDPWNLTDGVMAMALKLKKAGATSSSPSVIKKASINYLGTFNSRYYNGIVYWSKNYKLLFD